MVPELTHRYAILYSLYVGREHKVATLHMGDRLLRLGLRLSPDPFWSIVYVYLDWRKKGRITFFSPRIYIQFSLL